MAENLDQYTLDSLNALAAIGETIVGTGGESWARNPSGKASLECTDKHEDGSVCGVCNACEAVWQILCATQYIRSLELKSTKRKRDDS